MHRVASIASNDKVQIRLGFHCWAQRVLPLGLDVERLVRVGELPTLVTLTKRSEA